MGAGVGETRGKERREQDGLGGEERAARAAWVYLARGCSSSQAAPEAPPADPGFTVSSPRLHFF